MTRTETFRWTLAAIIVGSVLFRLLMLQPINEGPDEVDYWFAASRMFSDLPYPELMHRTIRWPIIVPTALVQQITGIHPSTYYVVPLLLTPIQSVLIYVIVRRHADRVSAMVAVLVLLAFPYLIRSNSQIRPEPFIQVFLMAMWLSLDRYLDHRGTRSLAMAAMWLYLAYLTKITSIYFLPGALALIVWYRRDSFRSALQDALLFGGILLGLYLVEHGLYFALADAPLGRIGIIMSTHIPGTVEEDALRGFWELFQRYRFDKLPIAWHLLIWGGLAAAVVEWRRSAWLRPLAPLFISFMVMMTFLVSGTDPWVPVEPFNNRYFIPMVFTVIPPLSLLIGRWGAKLPSGLRERAVPVAPLLLVAGAALVSLLPLPSAARRFYTPLNALSQHPLRQMEAITDDVRLAIEEETPIISVDKPSGYNRKGLDVVNRVMLPYLDQKRGAQRAPLSEGTWMTEGLRVDFLVAGAPHPETIPTDQEVLLVGRRPLRTVQLPLADALDSYEAR